MLISLLLCLYVRAEFVIFHERHRILHGIQGGCCCAGRNSRYQALAETRVKEKEERRLAKERKKNQNDRSEKEASGDDESMAKDRMVKLDTIIIVNCLVLVTLFITWYFNDSLWLRYVMIGIGTMSALYACADIYIDGIIYGDDACSDAGRMVELMNQRVSSMDRQIVVFQC